MKVPRLSRIRLVSVVSVVCVLLSLLFLLWIQGTFIVSEKENFSLSIDIPFCLGYSLSLKPPSTNLRQSLTDFGGIKKNLQKVEIEFLSNGDAEIMIWRRTQKDLPQCTIQVVTNKSVISLNSDMRVSLDTTYELGFARYNVVLDEFKYDSVYSSGSAVGRKLLIQNVWEKTSFFERKIKFSYSPDGGNHLVKVTAPSYFRKIEDSFGNEPGFEFKKGVYLGDEKLTHDYFIKAWGYSTIYNMHYNVEDPEFKKWHQILTIILSSFFGIGVGGLFEAFLSSGLILKLQQEQQRKDALNSRYRRNIRNTRRSRRIRRINRKR